LRIASFYRRRPGTLVGSPTVRYRLGRNAFITPFSTVIPLKVMKRREAVQGRRKTLKIQKHGKITY
jgi:hypothetical protein